MTPQGIVAILVGKDGRVIASVNEFTAGAPGGYTQREAQEVRARDALAMKAVRELSSQTLSEAVSLYVAKQIMDGMRHNGCRVEIVPVGYDESGQ